MRRHSPYREMVRTVIRSASGPLTAVEVRALLGDSGIGIATVYRLLNEGLEDGDFVGVELPNGPKRFEPADRPHHHHFECLACHKVFDVVGCPGGMDHLVPEGFELEQHEVILSGRCRECVSSS